MSSPSRMPRRAAGAGTAVSEPQGRVTYHAGPGGEADAGAAVSSDAPPRAPGPPARAAIL
jgi:hypothetical protein